jgi:hypothetical protein
VTLQRAELAFHIDNLASSDEERRKAAAWALFNQGAQMAWSVSEAWMNDGALTGVFAVEAYGEPGYVRPETTVGIAVSPETFAEICAANGNPPEAAVPPEQDAQEFELHFPANVRLDILTPRQTNGTGPLARYLRRNGPGIQQVEFRTYDVEGATVLLIRRFGLTPVFASPQPGANGARVNFLLVSTPNGERLLLELFQTP